MIACASERMTFSTVPAGSLPGAADGSRGGFEARLTTLSSYIKNVTRPKAISAIVLAIALTACRPPLHVGTLQLGNSLNGDNTVATHTTRFKPDDRIYAAVLTDATGSSTIAVRWFYNAQMVSEEERKVSYKGAGATAFEFKSASAFPVGDYRIEVLVDGQSVASRDFRVE